MRMAAAVIVGFLVWIAASAVFVLVNGYSADNPVAAMFISFLSSAVGLLAAGFAAERIAPRGRDENAMGVLIVLCCAMIGAGFLFGSIDSVRVANAIGIFASCALAWRNGFATLRRPSVTSPDDLEYVSLDDDTSDMHKREA